MRRDKVSMYVDILTALEKDTKIKFTHIMHRTNINNSVLREYLDFLILQGLVEKRTVGKETIAFNITERGSIVLKHFKEIRMVLLKTEDNELDKGIKENKEKNEIEARYQ